MGIQDENTKIKELFRKSKTLKELEIDWSIVIRPSVPCDRLKRISEKMSVDQGRRKVIDFFGGGKVQLGVWGRCQPPSGFRAGSWWS